MYETLNEEADDGNNDSSNYDLTEALTRDQDDPQIQLVSLSKLQSSHPADSDTGVNATAETMLTLEDVDEHSERTRNMGIAIGYAAATDDETVFDDMEDTSESTKLISISSPL